MAIGLAMGKRIVWKILQTGARITSDMLEEKQSAIPGARPGAISAADQAWKLALPEETRATAEPIWQVDPRTLQEMFFIWQVTGVLDQLKTVDPVLGEICSQILEEMLQEAGFEIQ